MGSDADQPASSDQLDQMVQALHDGLINRGRVAEGWHADLVLFDPDTVASDPIEARTDLPGDCMRLFAGAQGVHRVLVGGTDIVVDGQVTGATPGTVLRSGRDTKTALP